MGTDRELDEMIARCVASVVYYQNCGRTSRTREVLEADAEGVAEWAEGVGLEAESIGRALLQPLFDALIERYDRPMALALYGDFVAALCPRAAAPALACRA